MGCTNLSTTKSFIENELSKESGFIENVKSTFKMDDDIFEQFVRRFLSDADEDNYTEDVSGLKKFINDKLMKDPSEGWISRMGGIGLPAQSHTPKQVNETNEGAFSSGETDEEVLEQIKKDFFVFYPDAKDGEIPNVLDVYAIPFVVKTVNTKQQQTVDKIKSLIKKGIVSRTQNGKSGYVIMKNGVEEWHEAIGVTSFIEDDYIKETKSKLNKSVYELKRILKKYGLLNSDSFNSSNKYSLEDVSDERLKEIIINEDIKYNNKQISTSTFRDVSALLISNYPFLSSKVGNSFDDFSRKFFSYNFKQFENGKQFLVDIKDIDNKSKEEKEDLLDKYKDIIEKFNDDLEEKMFSPMGTLMLISDLNKVKESFGNNAVFITDDFVMVAELDKQSVQGKPDMLVIDENGEVIPVDFKTLKMKVSNGQIITDLSGERLERYTKQVSQYGRILKTYEIQVKNEGRLIVSNTFYDPSQGEYTLYDEDKTLEENYDDGVRYRVDNGQYYALYESEGKIEVVELAEVEEDINSVIKKAKNGEIEKDNINDFPFLIPRINSPESGGSEVKVITLDLSGNAKKAFDLNEDENRSNSNMVLETRTSSVVVVRQDDIYSNQSLVKSTEIKESAESLSREVSNIINIIKGEAYAEEDYIDDIIKEIFGGKDEIFGSLKNKDSIKIFEAIGRIVGGEGDFLNIGINKVIDYRFGLSFKEIDTNSSSRKPSQSDLGRDFIAKHKQEFVLLVKKLLRDKEPIQIKNIKDVDNYTSDDDADNSSEEDREYAEGFQDGTKDKEAYMTGYLQKSVEESLSEKLKRIFNTFVDVEEITEDGEGNKFCWARTNSLNIDKPISASRAVAEFEKICSDCSTPDEMIEVIKREISINRENRWMQQMINLFEGRDSLTGMPLGEDAMKNGVDLKHQFFRNMRKDANILSVIKLKFETRVDPETGAKTKVPVYNTYYINRNGIVDVLRYGMRYNLRNTPDPNKLLTDKNGYIDEYKIKEEVDKLKKISKKLSDLVKEYEESDADKELTDYERMSKKALYIREQIILEEGFSTIVDPISKALDAIGIKVTDDVIINSICKPINNRLSVGGLISAINNTLNNIKVIASDNDMKLSQYNIFGAKSSRLTTTRLFEFIKNHVQEHVESSAYNDGKTFYTYANPNYAGKIVRKLKDKMEHLNGRDAFSNGYDYFRSKNDDSIDFEYEDYIMNKYLMYSGWFSRSSNDSDLFVTNPKTNKRVINKDNILCYWLREIVSDKKMRDVFDHKINIEYNGKEYKEFGEAAMLLSMYSEYIGPSINRKNKNDEAWFATPTMSNKTSYEFFKFKRKKLTGNSEDAKSKLIDFFYENSLKYNYEQECNRIVDVLQSFLNSNNTTDVYDLTDKKLEKGGFDDIKKLKDRIKNHKLTSDDLKKLFKIKSGARFYFLPFLNNSESAIDKTVKVLNFLLTDPNDLGNNKGDIANLLADLKDDINNGYRELIESEIENSLNPNGVNLLAFEQNGDNIEYKNLRPIFNDNPGFLKRRKSRGELETIADYRARIENKVREKLFEFEANSIVANINIIQLTGIDLAYYGDSVTYQKRIAQMHSPGLEYGYSEADDKDFCDGRFRSVHVKTLKDSVDSDLKQSIKDSVERQYGEGTTTSRVIISLLDTVDITDGQSLNSPSSIRKKMKLAGEWDNEMETAYKKILSGNFDLNDIGIFLNPKKPFVYANVTKRSSSYTMAYRKVPLQDKNSELLIVLADAILRNDGKDNYFTKVFNLMESTHWSKYDFKNHKPADGATYLNDGIDTVHFDSVAKVGLNKTIDLNNISHDEIERFIKSNLLNTTGNKRFDGSSLRYNDQYVDEIDIDEYLEQQVVPGHLLEHYQLFGSQDRVLGVGDIDENAVLGTINGVEYKAGDTQKFIRDYKNLLAGNINDSYKDLRDELGLSSEDPEERIKKLHDILENEIINDPRASLDLLDAIKLVRVNNKLEFARPLMDPMISNRIETLFNSIVKKRINKQTIKGGPVVQASCLDKDLKIVRNNDGSIKYFEALMSVPDAYFEKLIISNGINNGLSQSKRGSYYTIDDIKNAINNISDKDKKEEASKMLDDMLTAIGYRIPTEDKYSMMPIKIVGFVPKFCGQIIMLPKEITNLTGSDFDIDKLFVMLKEFNKKILGKEEFIDILKKTGTVRSSESYNTLYKKYKNEDFSAFSMEERMELLFNTVHFYDHNDDAENERSLKKKRAIRNNQAFNMLYSVLNNQDTFIKQINPGNFVELDAIGSLISAIKNGSENVSNVTDIDNFQSMISKICEGKENVTEKDLDDHSVILNSSKIYFQKQNMQGSQMVGIFANHNVSHSIISQLRDENGSPLIIYPTESFSLCGKTIDSTNGTQLDPIKDLDGKLFASKLLATFVAASVDTAKKPCLANLNINTANGDTAMLLARMGFNATDIALLFTQPAIVNISNNYFANNNEGNFYNLQMAISSVKNELMDKVGTEDYTNLLDDIQKLLDDEEFLSSENLLNNLKNLDYLEGVDNDKNENKMFQLACVVLFERLANMSGDLMGLTYCTKFNSMKNASGPTIADSESKVARVLKFFEDVKGGKTIFGDSDSENAKMVLNIFELDPLLGAFWNSTLNPETGIVKEFFENDFVNYSRGFQDVLDYITKNCVKDGKVNNNTYKKLVNSYIYFLLTYGDSQFKQAIPTSKDEMDYLIKGIVNRYHHILSDGELSKLVKNNVLFSDTASNKSLYIRPKDELIGYDTLVFNGSGLDRTAQDEVRDAWSELLLSDNDEIKQFGQDLFFYTLARNGFGFSPKTLMHLASTIVVLNAMMSPAEESSTNNYISYLDGLRSILERANKFTFDGYPDFVRRFVDQFFRNNMNERSIIPNKTDSYSLFGSYSDGELSIWDNEEKTALLPYVIGKTEDKEEILLPFIVCAINNKNKLFKLSEGSDRESGILVYDEISPLGVNNNFVEYDANNDLNESYFSENPLLEEDYDEEDDTDDEEELVYDSVEDDDQDEEILDDQDEDDRDEKEIMSKFSTIVRNAIRGGSTVNVSNVHRILKSVINGTSNVSELDGLLPKNSIDEIQRILDDNNIC